MYIIDPIYQSNGHGYTDRNLHTDWE